MAPCLTSRIYMSTTATSTRSRVSTCTWMTARIVTLIGSNGAGKTTTLRAISRSAQDAGSTSIVYDGADISQLRPHQVVERGVIHVPEGRRVFRA